MPDPLGGTNPRSHFMYIVVDLALTPSQVTDIFSFTPQISYNFGEKLLSISCDCLDTGLASLRVITDYTSGKTLLADASAQFIAALTAVYAADNTHTLVQLTRDNYLAYLSNIGITENFVEAPYYATNLPYYMGSTGVELGESEEEQYYRNIVGVLPYYELEEERIKVGIPRSDRTSKIGPI